VKSADDAAPKTKKGKRRAKLQVMNDDIRIALSEKNDFIPSNLTSNNTIFGTLLLYSSFAGVKNKG
jgi:hypothetical protein